jgi:hypothetical protein
MTILASPMPSTVPCHWTDAAARLLRQAGAERQQQGKDACCFIGESLSEISLLGMQLMPSILHKA